MAALIVLTRRVMGGHVTRAVSRWYWWLLDRSAVSQTWVGWGTVDFRVVVEFLAVDVTDAMIDEWSDCLDDLDLGLFVSGDCVNFAFKVNADSLHLALSSASGILELLKAPNAIRVNVMDARVWKRPPVVPIFPRVFATNGAAEYLGVRAEDVESFWRSGLLAGHRMHGDLVFHLRDLEELAEVNSIQAV